MMTEMWGGIKFTVVFHNTFCTAVGLCFIIPSLLNRTYTTTTTTTTTAWVA
jgi:hypothetical protein